MVRRTKIGSVEYLMRTVNRRRSQLDLPEILTDGNGRVVRVNRKGKFVKVNRKGKFVKY